MKRKELRRLIGHFLKLNQQMTGSSKMLTQLQVNITFAPSNHVWNLQLVHPSSNTQTLWFLCRAKNARGQIGETQHKYTRLCQTLLIASNVNRCCTSVWSVCSASVQAYPIGVYLSFGFAGWDQNVSVARYQIVRWIKQRLLNPIFCFGSYPIYTQQKVLFDTYTYRKMM